MIALNTWFDLALEEAALVGDDPVVAGYGLGREVGGGPRRLDEVAGAVLAAHHPECRLDEDAMALGANVLVRAARRFLANH